MNDYAWAWIEQTNSLSLSMHLLGSLPEWWNGNYENAVEREQDEASCPLSFDYGRSVGGTDS